MQPRVPERNKKAGVFYAVTEDGFELPIIDVTHPSFAISLSDKEQRTRLEQFASENQPLSKLPPLLRRIFFRVFLRGSVLAGGLRRAQGTFLSGLSTYLLKLGPENLGSYVKPIDRRIAAALPSFMVRVRLQDMAELLASGLAPLLADSTRPLHLINIAGGPAMDSLNALILLRRDHPALLEGRRIEIDVLDLDDKGPRFGQRALEALRSDGGPLRGIEVTFRHISHDWRDTTGLERLLAGLRERGDLAAASSEGGLFEYGSDEEILANLKSLRATGPDGLFMAASVTRSDPAVHMLRQTGRAATRPRGLTVFTELVGRAGWKVTRVVERAFSDQVVIVPASP